MLEIFSACGSFVHTPCGPRKSGMPESVEMPAPVRATTRLASFTHRATSAMRVASTSGHLDLAAAARHAAGGRQAALRDDDRGGCLATKFLQLLHGALDRFLRKAAELL